MVPRGAPGRLTSYFSTLGQLTRSLYMIHRGFQTVVLDFIGGRIAGPNGAWSIAFTYLMLPVLIAVSCVSLRAIETPARKVMRSFG